MPARKRVPSSVLCELRQAVIKGITRAPKISELVQHFFDLAGGERAVAKMLLDEYRSEKCSAHVRSRILDVILRSLQFANARETPRDDLGNLSEEDLETELLALYEASDGKKEADTAGGVA